jgi:hypothetical protein
MAGFKLQLEISEIAAYAARYRSSADDAVLAIGSAARQRGLYTLEQFIVVCRWKTPRSGPLVAANTAGEVEAATRVALSGASGERERMEALRSLAGVEYPTASVLLHVAYPERYPILDRRALHALGVTSPVSYGLRFWTEYVEAYRRLIAEAGVDGRTLDRALWQWSSEQPVALRWGV